MQPRILWSEIYDIPTPKSVLIGDSSYLEQIALGAANRKIENQVYRREKIPCSYKAKLVFRKESVAEDYSPVFSASVYVCHKDYIGTYASGSYYPSAIRKGGERMLETQTGNYKVVTTYRKEDIEGRTEYSAEFDMVCDGYLGTVTDCVKAH